MSGFIKTYRSLLNWEWYGNPDMVALWIHLLLSANYEDKRWKGSIIRRGQFVTSLHSLSEQTGISIRSLRTCLERLKQTGEIEEKTTNKFRIITICNFDSYQSIERSTDKQPTNNRQTTDKQPTTTEEYKEYNNNLVCDARARLEAATIQNSLWLDKTAMELRCPNVMQLAEDVMTEWELTQLPDTEWTVQHLYNHMRKKLYLRAQEDKTSKLDAKEARRAQLKKDSLNDLKSILNGNYQQQTEYAGVDESTW